MLKAGIDENIEKGRRLAQNARNYKLIFYLRKINRKGRELIYNRILYTHSSEVNGPTLGLVFHKGTFESILRHSKVSIFCVIL